MQTLPQRGYDRQPRVAALRGYPGERAFSIQPQKRLRRLLLISTSQNGNRVAVENHSSLCSQGCRSGNPGLEVAAPFGAPAKNERSTGVLTRSGRFCKASTGWQPVVQINL
jgi:hypothetical protein